MFSTEMFILELCFEFGESWPLAGVIRPTFGHQTVERGWALRGHSQPLAVFNPANHVVILHTLEGLDAIHQNLPHTHTYRETRLKRVTYSQSTHDKYIHTQEEEGS